MFSTAHSTMHPDNSAAYSSSSSPLYPPTASIAQDISSFSSCFLSPLTYATRPFSSPSSAASSPSVSPFPPTNFVKEEWPRIHNKEHLIPDLTHSTEEHIRQHVEREGKLLVRVVTWNQQAQPPPSTAELRRCLLPPNRFHIYAIGSQECGQSIATSVVLSSSKVAWEEAARKALGASPEFPRSLEKASGVSRAAAEAAASSLCVLAAAAPAVTLQAVYKKYCGAKFGEVARLVQAPAPTVL